MTNPSKPPDAQASTLIGILRGLGAAIFGAFIGLMAFTMLARWGVYPIAIIGVVIGSFCSWLSGRKSVILGIVCLLLAVVTIFVAEIANFPFDKEDRWRSFFVNLANVHQLFWLSLILGSGLAFWIGMGNERTTPRHGS